MDYADGDFEQFIKNNYDADGKQLAKEDPNLRVYFEWNAIKRDPTISEIEQFGDHPQFDRVPYLHKSVPGNTETIIHRPATDKDKRRHPRQWKAFVSKDDTVTARGMPLGNWTPCDKATFKTLEYRGVHTVEELAALSETAARGMGPGILDISKKAKGWLDASRDGAATAKLSKERDEARNEIDTLKAQVADLIKASHGQLTPKQSKTKGD